MGVITDIRPYKNRKPYKGPINGPCSPCGDGDTALEYHDHEPPARTYTLTEIEQLAQQWFDSFDPDKIDVTDAQLIVSLFTAWLARREREVGNGN